VILVVTGTGTGVGKTVVTAAVAALARDRGASVAVAKPAQTGLEEGEYGDLHDVHRLSGADDLHEWARYPDPLAPATAARRVGIEPLRADDVAHRVRELDDRDLVLVEGAGGLLVRYDEQGSTIADVARLLDAAVLVVTRPGLGTLSDTALTLEAMAHRGLRLGGLVIGDWPDEPDLAMRCNISDLETVACQPLAGVLPSGAGVLDPETFLAVARRSLGPALGGRFDAAGFRHHWSMEVHG
jgi:dethiobiotin synthetase